MPEDFITTEPAAYGLQRLLARFGGHAYDPHRHETYAVGATLSGAQAFRYRGTGRVSRAGQCMVLHPDEWHDGRSEVPEGFLYRMVYVEPPAIRAALGDRGALPFVGEAVSDDGLLSALIGAIFATFPDPLDPLAADGFLAELALLLAHRTGMPAVPVSVPAARIARVKELIDSEYERQLGSAELERLSGLDRFETARLFRRLNGTSPHRYLVGRRLTAAHQLIARGEALADVAQRVGFADQSHLTRAFKARYGITPGRFRALAAAGGR